MDYTQWAETLSLSVTRLVERGIAFLPNILTALALVLLGWVLARSGDRAGADESG